VHTEHRINAAIIEDMIVDVALDLLARRQQERHEHPPLSEAAR
jgi:hypothetical protein